MLKEADWSEVVNLTGELVKIPSENPNGSEKAIGEYVFHWLQQQGVTAWKEQVEGDRFNVVARVGNKGYGSTALIWLAHMDTVPVGEGWTEDPFGGRIKAGRLYGRGSADMKGGLAAALVAIRDLALMGQMLKGELILLATVDEEGQEMKGAMTALKNGLVGKDSLLVAIEPSGLKLMPAHKGPNWYKITTRGKMAHAGKPDKGVDAIHAASQIMVSLKELIANLPYRDELLGPTTINLGRINGGLKTNIVPHYCEAEVDMRVTFPMSIEEADSLVDRALEIGLAKVSGAKATWERLGLKRKPLKMPADSPLLLGFQAAVKEVVGDFEIAGFPAYTDAAILAATVGSPHCLTFGPGYLDQAHAVDEYVPVEQLQAAVAVLKAAALQLLG
ncbi:MAG: M20 family metallopeptidase [Bacillota bacterium]